MIQSENVIVCETTSKLQSVHMQEDDLEKRVNLCLVRKNKH